MFGNLLFRKSIQILKKETKGKIPLDDPMEEDLKAEWLEYFEMLQKIDKILFPRCVKPENYDLEIDPDLVTFKDGNPNAYGVTAYILWTEKRGRFSAKLLMSKAKLGPLSHKGETVWNELS